MPGQTTVICTHTRTEATVLQVTCITVVQEIRGVVGTYCGMHPDGSCPLHPPNEGTASVHGQSILSLPIGFQAVKQ